MAHESVTRDAMTLVGIETRASNDRADLLGAQWGRFMGQGLAETIVGRVDDSIVAVYCEYEGDHTQPYTFFLGCRVDPEAQAPGDVTPEGMTRRTVGGGDFVRVVAVGEQPAALIEAWTGIWGSSIERAFDTDFEIHAPGGERVEIFVGV